MRSLLNLFSFKRTNLSSPVQPSLELERLEDRIMLSTVQIFAAGQTGNETMHLKVDGEVVAEFQNVGGNSETRDFETFVWQDLDRAIVADQIEIEFVNDRYVPELGIDNNLYVDKIVLNGRTYETEFAGTTASRIWIDGGVEGPGNFETEMLNIAGSFRYANFGATPINDGARLDIITQGSTGEETFLLRINGDAVAEYSTSQRFQTVSFSLQDTTLTGDQISIEFNNDLYNPDAGVDRNLRVFEVSYFESNPASFINRWLPTDPTTFSTGTWVAEDGIQPGFGRGDTLHANGLMRFG